MADHDVSAHVFAAGGPFEEHPEVVGAAPERLDEGEIAFYAPPALHDLLRLRLVIPEAGLFYLAIDLAELLFELCALKDTSGVPSHGGSGPHAS